MHASWIAVNPIQGCPNNCRYCFMKRYQASCVVPEVVIEYKKVIPMLLMSKYYLPDTPLCLFPGTDIMATSSNVEYLIELIREIKDSEIHNPIVLVTKCFIPDEVIHTLKKLQDSGREIVVYLSYSGLPAFIEPKIDIEKIRNNFVRLHENSIKTIHYFRPIVPQNSTMETMNDIIAFTKKYAIASVVTGLKVYNDGMNNLDFWKELYEVENAESYECIWPTGALEIIKEVAKKYCYPIFQSNSCALAMALGETDRYGYLNSDVCRNFNNCPDDMRSRCRIENVSSLELITDKVSQALVRLGLEQSEYVIDPICKVVHIRQKKLNNQDICYISRVCRCHIELHGEKENAVYWNSGISNSPQIIL